MTTKSQRRTKKNNLERKKKTKKKKDDYEAKIDKKDFLKLLEKSWKSYEK